jgi:branched-subunit amino acid transport protein
MTTAWWLVLLLGTMCASLRAIGPVALGGRRLPPNLTAALDILTPALLAAFVVTQTLTTGRRVVVDARLVGIVAAAVVALWRRSPVLVLVTAACATAAARALGVGAP